VVDVNRGPDGADNADPAEGVGVQLLTVPRAHLTVDNMKQDVSTATLTSNEDYNLS